MTTINATDLISRYFELAVQSDLEAYYAQFASDEIRAWRTEVPPVHYDVTCIEATDSGHDAGAEISGDCPGSPVELRFRFEIEHDALIHRLVIEPAQAPGTILDAVPWNDEIVEQIDGHWTHQFRPRLAGLTTEEFLWEPVDGCWSIRPASPSRSGRQLGRGGYRLDMVRPQPDPAPVTTIAWRMAHLTVSVIGQRLAGLFDGPPVSYDTYQFAGTADPAVSQLDAVYAHWIECVRGLGDDGLLKPCGESEAAYGNSPDLPMVAIVVHISREIIHHGAEISLLRDLYRARFH